MKVDIDENIMRMSDNMSVHVCEEKGKVTFSNRIAYVCDVFEFKRPVTYNCKNLTLEDGTPVIWGYIEQDALESNVLPMTIFGKTYDEMIVNAYLQIICNYFEGQNSIKDPIVKYVL